MHITKVFEKGNSIYMQNSFRNLNNDLSEPTSPDFSIYNGSGTKVTDAATLGGPFKRKTGVWYFRWTPTTVGDYYVVWTGTVESMPVTFRRPFRVIETTKVY